MVRANRKNRAPFDVTEGFRLLQQVLQTHAINTRSRIHEVKAATQLHTKIMLLILERVPNLVPK